MGCYDERASWRSISEGYSYEGVTFLAAPIGSGVQLAMCTKCKNLSFWIKGNMVFPDVPNVEAPNADLDQDIKDDYLEAASVFNKSPRAAAALLRLALQKLCKQLGEKGENIHEDINSLLKKGMPSRVMKAMNAVRIIGNHAVHPGKLDFQDNIDIAAKLFRLINSIARDMITEPKELEEISKIASDSDKRKNHDGNK